MPMVGTSSDSVMAAPTCSGIPSSTTAKQPAATMALAPTARAWAAASSRPWTLYPPNTLTDCGVSPRWPITGISADTRASIIGTRLAPPSSLTAWAPARIKVAAFWTVSTGSRW